MQSKAVEKEYKTIRWLGLTAPVTSAKVKQILESADNLDSQLAQTDNYDGKVCCFWLITGQRKMHDTWIFYIPEIGLKKIDHLSIFELKNRKYCLLSHQLTVYIDLLTQNFVK